MDLQIWDVVSGIGEIDSVLNVLEAMYLTIKEGALLFLITARCSSYQVNVYNATKGIDWSMVSVSWLQLKTFLMLDVIYGTGMKNVVWNVLKDGYLTWTVFVLK